MGRVDPTNQIVGLYYFNRKFKKWLMKVFYKLLMMAVRNTHILYDDVKRKKTFFLPLLITIAKVLIALGRSGKNVKKKFAKSLERLC